MDITREILSLDYLRRYGAEIEVNAFDMRHRPIGYEDGKLPEGIYYVGNLVKKITEERVLIHKWGNDHYNDCWIVKPDSSCGMEIGTPVLKGWHGILRICRVIDGLRQDPKISADARCSFHVHVDISDLTEKQLAAVLTWWIKCEAVFMDAVPSRRKKSQYCQFLGLMDMFEDMEDGMYSPEVLFKRVGHCKYYTINTFHYQQKKRKTIEFRIMDNDCCLNPWVAKNWIRLVLHFVERAAQRGMPEPYQGDKWTGYAWLDPIDVFEFLGFRPDQCVLSPGLQQVRRWFLSRLYTHGRNTGLRGVMSDKARRIANDQVDQLLTDLKMDPSAILEVGSDDDIYGENFRV
jgi:hypothetical protein